MTDQSISDEMLMALADGELAAEDASVARAATADPAIETRLAMFRNTRSIAGEAFAGLLNEPVPERLVAAATQSGKPPSRLAWLSRSIRLPVSALPIAASIALAACIGAFIAGSSMRGSAVAPLMPLTDRTTLAAAIAGTPSGGSIILGEGANRITATAIASYRVADGVCRILEAKRDDGGSVRGLGCNLGSGWHVPLAVTGAAGDYGPAAGAATSSIDAYLDAIQADGPLGEAEEDKLIRDGWRRNQSR